MNIYLAGSFLTFLSFCGFGGYLVYNKIFGPRKYKILKEYKYKHSEVQLIKNPQNNICPHCFEILEQDEEIGRFPHCDHHYCQDCIHIQIDNSQSDLHPCQMCMT